MQSGNSTFQHQLKFDMCLLSMVMDYVLMDGYCLVFTYQADRKRGPHCMPEQTDVLRKSMKLMVSWTSSSTCTSINFFDVSIQ